VFGGQQQSEWQDRVTVWGGGIPTRNHSYYSRLGTENWALRHENNEVIGKIRRMSAEMDRLKYELEMSRMETRRNKELGALRLRWVTSSCPQQSRHFLKYNQMYWRKFSSLVSSPPKNGATGSLPEDAARRGNKDHKWEQQHQMVARQDIRGQQQLGPTQGGGGGACQPAR